MAALALCCAAGQAPAWAETLQQAVQRTLSTNPEILAAGASQRATSEQVSQARGGYLPTLDLSASGGREKVDTPGLRAQGLGNREMGRDETTLTLRQMLFDGLQTRNRVVQQNARLDSATFRIAEVGEDLGLRVVDIYTDVLRTTELLRLARENETAHLDTLEKTRLRFKSGVGSRADMQQAEGRLALARTAITQREGALREAEARYLRVTGTRPAVLARPAPAQGLPATLADAVEKGLAGHPLVKGAEADLAATGAALDVSRGSFSPRFDLELSRGQRHNTGGSEGQGSDASALLVMRYNLFRGGADLAATREQVERREAARETLANARRIVEENIARSWAGLAAVRAALPQQEQHVASSREVLTAYRSQFELGRRTLLDLLNGENELFQARSSLVAGQYDVLFGEYRVLAAIGVLARAFE